MKVEFGPYKDEGEQKVDIQIDPWDTWNMDYTLSLLIHPMLMQLKVNKHGAPIVDYEDVPKNLRPTEEEIALYREKGETDEKFFDRWDYVMDEMIWTFEQKANDDNAWSKYDNELDRMKHANRMQNGFRLFGKYYESLWD